MATFGNFDYTQFKKLQKKLLALPDPEKFVEECTKELAARVLKEVKERTDPGDYRKKISVTAKRNSKNHKKGDVYLKPVPNSIGGKTGGTLRRGWTVGGIKRSGNSVFIEIINPVEYASYVEYGHRQTPGRYVPAIGKRLKKSWVPGKFMLKTSMEKVQKISGEIIRDKMNEYFAKGFK